jgi:hypothetical protein
MNRGWEQEHLDQAYRHIAELKAHIVRQRILLKAIALVFCGSIGIIRRRDRIEARLLFVTEGLVEALEGRAHGLHGRKHDLQTALHRRKPSSRDAGQVLRASL